MQLIWNLPYDPRWDKTCLLAFIKPDYSQDLHLTIIHCIVVVDCLFIVTPIVGVCNCSMFCCMLLYVQSSIAIILMGKRELVALLNLSSWCLVMVERLFLVVPGGCLQFVGVVFPDHTHLLFFFWSRAQISKFEFCCTSMKKKLVTIFSQEHVWGLRNPCFSKFSEVNFL